MASPSVLLQPTRGGGGAANRAAAGKGRSAVLLVTVCLALATGVALVGAGTALTDARVSPIAGSATANEAIVGAFYDAVNVAIGTGETDAFDPLVAQDVDWCGACPGQSPGRAGLVRYLVELHRTAPEARITVDEVVAGGDGTAMARAAFDRALDESRAVAGSV